MYGTWGMLGITTTLIPTPRTTAVKGLTNIWRLILITPPPLTFLWLPWVCVKDVVNFAQIPLLDKATKPYVMYVKHLELRPCRLSISVARPDQPHDRRQRSIRIWLNIWATACCRQNHLCTLDHIPVGTATWRWWFRCDCNHSSDRSHHPTTWQSPSGSCWCHGATLTCWLLALPFPVKGGSHGRGWHDSLLSMFQMAPRTVYYRRVHHKGHTVLDFNIGSPPTIHCVYLQCHIGTSVG